MACIARHTRDTVSTNRSEKQNSHVVSFTYPDESIFVTYDGAVVASKSVVIFLAEVVSSVEPYT